MTEITGSFVSIDDSNITSSKTSVQQLIDIVQADISSDSGSSTRKKYQVFVSGGTNLASITSSLYQTVFDQDFTLGTSNALFDVTIGSFLDDSNSDNITVNGVVDTTTIGTYTITYTVQILDLLHKQFQQHVLCM